MSASQPADILEITSSPEPVPMPHPVPQHSYPTRSKGRPPRPPPCLRLPFAFTPSPEPVLRLPFAFTPSPEPVPQPQPHRAPQGDYRTRAQGAPRGAARNRSRKRKAPSAAAGRRKKARILVLVIEPSESESEDDDHDDHDDGDHHNDEHDDDHDDEPDDPDDYADTDDYYYDDDDPAVAPTRRAPELQQHVNAVASGSGAHAADADARVQRTVRANGARAPRGQTPGEDHTLHGWLQRLREAAKDLALAGEQLSALRRQLA